MTITSEFLAALAQAAEALSSPRAMRWPSPGRLGAFIDITNFTEWREVILACRLSDGVPHNMKGMFDRALKLFMYYVIDTKKRLPVPKRKSESLSTQRLPDRRS